MRRIQRPASQISGKGMPELRLVEVQNILSEPHSPRALESADARLSGGSSKEKQFSLCILFMMARFASTACGLVIFKRLQLSPPVNTYSELGTSLPQLPTLAAGLYLSARCFPVLLGDDGDLHGTILRKVFPKGTPVSSGRREGTLPRTGKRHVHSKQCPT